MTTRTANEEYLDALIRHQIYILRYSGTVRNKILRVLGESEENIRDIINSRIGDGGLVSPTQWRRLERIKKAVTKARGASWDAAIAGMKDDLVALAKAEPAMLQGILTTVMPVQVITTLPDARTLRAIALSRPFEGRLLRDWARDLRSADLRRIHSTIQSGMVEGVGSREIARRVLGTGSARGIDGVTQMTRNQVEAVTRTAVQHVANYARREFINDNQDIIEQEQYVATLDSRTTAVCRANDGKVFEFAKGPQPPLHFNCRSLRIAYFDGVELGERPMKPTTEKQLLREFTGQRNIGVVTSRSALPRGTKGAFDTFSRNRVRELVGRVPAKTTYQQFLQRQPQWFQQDVLGTTKAKLFRDGNLRLDQFVDAKGKELTLGQLAARHKRAFKSAGLDASQF